VIERLSSLIDISTVEPYYNKTNIRFSPDMFSFLKLEIVRLVQTKKANKSGVKVERTQIYSLASVSTLPILLSTGKANNRKDKYLLNSYSGGFIRIKPPIWTKPEAQEWSQEELMEKLIIGSHGASETTAKKKLDSNVAEEIWALLKDSGGVLDYEAVEVPDSFTGSNDEEDLVEEEHTVEEVKAAAMSKAVLHTPRWMQYSHGLDKMLEWQKVEVSMKEIEKWDEEEIYYGSDADKDTLQFVTFLTRDTRNKEWYFCRDGFSTVTYYSLDNTHRTYEEYSANNSVTGNEAYRCTHFFNTPIKVIKVSQSTVKCYRDFYHINKFFYRLNNGVLTMSNILIKWNTARQLKKELHKLNFLWNFSFCPERQEKFIQFVQYVKENYRETTGFEDKGVKNELTDKLVSHLDKVQQFQEFVQVNQNPEDIAKLALEMWKTDKVTDSCAIDMVLWNEFKELLEWAEPLGALLNEMPVLTGINSTARTTTDSYQSRTTFPSQTEELERAIISYTKSKDVTLDSKI
jgi:hypothetical protein